MARKVNYHESAFWEERYKQNVCEWFEWLAPPNQFNALLHEKIAQNSNILELGCGSSNLAEKLTTLQHNVTCLDFSKEIIKSRTKGNSNSKITYKLHNINEKLPFEDGTFDVIIEKNTIDCLFCQQNFISNVMRCMKECFRVLKPNGKMISITHGKQKNRRFFYRNRFSPFHIEVLPLPNRKPSQAQVLLFILSKEEEPNAIKQADENNEEGNSQNEENNDQQGSVHNDENGNVELQEQQNEQGSKLEGQEGQNGEEEQKQQQKEQEGQQDYEFDQLANQEQDQ